MLFADEAAWRDHVTGAASFRADFESRGERQPGTIAAPAGISSVGLFRYPCSFLIYSDSFEALPAAVKDPLYQRCGTY